MILMPIMLLLSVSVSAMEDQLPSPENMRTISQDLGLVLEWDPPLNSTNNNITYTAEYLGWKSFQPVCQNITSRSCDFTSKMAVFGVYKFRVRAELGGRSSNWVETDSISLDKITVISAPDVKLQSRNGEIEVEIIDPVLKKGSLRDIYHPVSYHIRYWIEGETKKEVLKAKQTRLMLPNLTPKVQYCVQIEIVVDVTKISLPSNETCVLNTENGVQPWLIVVVLVVSFVVVLVLVVLVFLAVWYTYRGIRFLHPKAKLPEHFKYLCDLPKSSLFLAMQNSPQPQECYHEVSIIPCLEDSSVSQDKQKIESPKCRQPFANVSKGPIAEEGWSQEDKQEEEQKKDCEHSEKNGTPTGCHEDETVLLLH
ncbi:cytokine receptor family member b4 [Hoplias malabaricus]|uniref:cytokine receptor family member b4 n=1 Tax=Hoplias malabaricus TaxID=27720 RepID=UPI0034637C4C